MPCLILRFLSGDSCPRSYSLLTTLTFKNNNEDHFILLNDHLIHSVSLKHIQTKAKAAVDLFQSLKQTLKRKKENLVMSVFPFFRVLLERNLVGCFLSKVVITNFSRLRTCGKNAFLPFSLFGINGDKTIELFVMEKSFWSFSILCVIGGYFTILGIVPKATIWKGQNIPLWDKAKWLQSSRHNFFDQGKYRPILFQAAELGVHFWDYVTS